jgi:GT2 family glycosyltransferase
VLPPLSIVIPSHNRPDLLRRCLASVTRHAPAASEVLVVDDGSPGECVGAAARDFSGVRCLRLARRRGFCVAANAGIRATTHPVVELLNDDTEVTAGWAEAALAWFARPEVGAVAPLVLRWPTRDGEPPHIDSAGDRYFVGGIAGKRGHGEPLREEHLQARPVFGACGAAAFYRRESVLAVGCFPERFGAYFEDVDLSFRLHWAGLTVMYEPAARVRHRESASYGRPGWRLLAQQSRNEERVFWRNLPAGMLLRALPLHLAVVAAKAWRRCCEGELLPFLLGRLGVLAEVGELLRHRRRLRKTGGRSSWTDSHVEHHFWHHAGASQLSPRTL